MKTAVKHKTGAEGGDRTHSLAMTKDFMDDIVAWSESRCPIANFAAEAMSMDVRTNLTMHLEFLAFASTGWTIWSRYAALQSDKQVI